jgi:hypothetical protein
MAVGRRGRKKERKRYLWGTVIGLVVVCVVAAISAFLATREPPPDSVSLCPAAGPRGHYVILVDKTDPLTFTQKQALTVLLQEVIDRRLPEGYLLSLFALGEDFRDSAAPLVELCNPGSGVGKSELTATLSHLHKRYQEQFLAKITSQLNELETTKPAAHSPIFEMLQLVGLHIHKRHVTGERRLIVVSDMLANTRQFSMFREIPEFANFQASEYGSRSNADLSGVDVELNYLLFSPKLQTRRQLKFWEDYFGRAGAKIVVVHPLEG